MTLLVTPYLVQLTFEAALKSFWRKDALRKFLRECHVSEAHLSTWATEEVKRTFLDRTFAALQRTENGKRAVGKMAVALAEQTTFPDLRDWEDSQHKVAEARRAVFELKALIDRQHEEVRQEREVKAAKAVAQAEKEQVQRSRLSLEKLMQQLTDLHPQMGTSPGGYAFQEWVYDLLTFGEIDNRRPYITEGRQIDGSITIDGTTYLIEMKFADAQAAATDIDIFRSKIESKADNTMGLFISMAGYSSVAVKGASGKQTTMLLIDAPHIYLVLTGAMCFQDLVRRVRRHAAQTGESYLAVSAFGG